MRRSIWNRLMERLERLLTAIAWAEEGEVDTARRLVGDMGQGRPQPRGRTPSGTPLGVLAPRPSHP